MITSEKIKQLYMDLYTETLENYIIIKDELGSDFIPEAFSIEYLFLNISFVNDSLTVGVLDGFIKRAELDSDFKESSNIAKKLKNALIEFSKRNPEQLIYISTMPLDKIDKMLAKNVDPIIEHDGFECDIDELLEDRDFFKDFKKERKLSADMFLIFCELDDIFSISSLKKNYFTIDKLLYSNLFENRSKNKAKKKKKKK